MVSENTLMPPIGWRKLNHGEVIKDGDAFNNQSVYPDEKPVWIFYKSLVGTTYQSHLFSIRCLNDDEKLLLPDTTSYKKIEPKETIKERIQKYLNKK